MTLSEQWGRLFVSVNYSVRTPNVAATPKGPAVRAGVDLGLRTLATVATVDESTGEQTIVEYVNPARCGRLCVSAAGPVESFPAGSRLPRLDVSESQADRLDRRCVHLRREATHQLTTELASEYGHVVIEDLDVAAMKRSMGRRAFRRAVSDAAMGLVRPQLAYKTARHGVTLTVADRWLPPARSITAACSPTVRRAGWKARWDSGKITMDKVLRCPITGEDVDRDINAACNLRDWPELPVDAQSGRRPAVSSSRDGPGDGGSDSRHDRPPGEFA